MTLQEYYACLRALLFYGKGVRIVSWAVVAVGAACLALSAAMTWGTPASILAGVALTALVFSITWSGKISARRRRRTYTRFRESNTSYIFTNERILATSRYAQSSFAWGAVNRVMEMGTVYLLDLGNSFICIPKRDIPPAGVSDFVQLLRTHRLLGET